MCSELKVKLLNGLKNASYPCIRGIFADFLGFWLEKVLTDIAGCSFTVVEKASCSRYLVSVNIYSNLHYMTPGKSQSHVLICSSTVWLKDMNMKNKH